MSKYNLINKDYKILIVGLGLLGGSYAQGLTDTGFTVGAIDVSQESIDYAIEKGIIKNGYTTVNEEYVSQFDLIIFALYPKVLIEWLKQYQSYFKKGAVITDVTGIKSWVDNEIRKFIRDDIEYVLAHPMAGKEVYGVKNSSKDLFVNANYLITPTSKNTKEVIEKSKKLAYDLGFKNVSILSVEEHDEMIAFLSQLTHCIAVSLMTCKESTHLKEYTGDSFRDLTRIAKINETLWSELFFENKDNLIPLIDSFVQELNKLKSYVENEDSDNLKAMFIESTKRRKAFDK